MAKCIYTVYDEHDHPHGCRFKRPSMTQQHYKDECDINNIMRRAITTGTPLVDPLVQAQATRKPMFGDYSNMPDLQTAMAKIHEAQEMFGALPSSIRRKFDNDPAAFVAFCQDPANLDEMRELGLIPKLRTDSEGREYYVRDGLPVYTGYTGRGSSMDSVDGESEQK